MHEAVENSKAVLKTYDDRTDGERGKSVHSSTKTNHRTSSETGRESVPLSSILVTAGGATGAAFLGASIAGPLGLLGGAVLGTLLGVYLQRPHK